MAINEIVKNALKTHKSKIELTQWAIIDGVASLIYSEYIYNMKNKVTPGKTILMVPKISTVQELLSEESQLITWISDNLIDKMMADILFKQFIESPELEMFKENNVEIMKTILDLYIIPNISRCIPDTIAKKFAIGDPKNQDIRESNEIDLFHRNPISDDYLDYLSHEIVLKLLTLLPTVKKDIEVPESNASIQMSAAEILTIRNVNAICPVLIDNVIINNSIMKLLSFVTNTSIEILNNIDITGKKKNGLTIDYLISTGAFNSVSLTHIIKEELDES